MRRSGLADVPCRILSIARLAGVAEGGEDLFGKLTRPLFNRFDGRFGEFAAKLRHDRFDGRHALKHHMFIRAGLRMADQFDVIGKTVREFAGDESVAPCGRHK